MGNGFFDEDGRHTYLGTEVPRIGIMSGANATARADLDNFLQQYADMYFTINESKIHKYFPKVLVYGVLSMNGFNGVTRAPILKAAAAHIDVLDATLFNQAVLDFTFNSWGDKPVVSWEGSFANPDSEMPPCITQCDNFSVGFNSTLQSTRGAFMASRVNTLFNLAASNGSHLAIGFKYWEYPNSNGEMLNWGMVSFEDNPYDGVADRVATGVDLWGFPIGGEAANHGDFLGPFRSASVKVVQSIP